MTDLEMAEQMVTAAESLVDRSRTMLEEATALRDELYNQKYPAPDIFEAMGFPKVSAFPSVR